MKVLVIGASGYLGYWVTKLLTDSGDSVVELSRRGESRHGEAIVGDVTSTGLGLSPEALAELADVDAVVSCFGSVDWDLDPSALVNLHLTGTRNVLDTAAKLPSVRRVVHVSSLLALGRAEGVVGNGELAVGQTFRNWYEYAKYRSEALARRERRVPVSIVRFGPLLGPAPAELVPATGGPLQALPSLLQGMPLFLERGGRFPVYVGDVAAAAGVVASLARAAEAPAVCTYFDPKRPTLARVLHELCQPYGVVPRLVDGTRGRWLQRLVASRMGLTDSTLEYTSPLPSLAPDVLEALPWPSPVERPGYISATADILRDARRVLLPVDAEVSTP
ncbi:SDR family oxidoreductase [Streptomyces sp. H27-D2]|uniref:SDR family oxidoreductase n=1 Tax=Streptomyces sp. H27-D2 TaxID=3046304 RepID=UPI002DB96137|nr:SDR family oxidoreductase [Streptomyces sp. H27-D2]MEC4015028.1 SDR family oxidoreductase [Streptomyces sp. H27-D2]